jgi:hypothetical protein
MVSLVKARKDGIQVFIVVFGRILFEWNVQTLMLRCLLLQFIIAFVDRDIFRCHICFTVFELDREFAELLFRLVRL